FFFSSRRRHTRWPRDWSSDVCSSDLVVDGHRKTFESLGCIVEQAEPDFGPAETAFRVLRSWNSANTYAARLKEHPDAFKDTLKGEIEEGLRLTGVDLAHAETAHGQLWRRFQV